ncbi:MAG: T9SS type A sorting domain-containing protein [Dysgonamonadaceae bacterium]|jgi:hypothetical protein|nr:T9SS type A sorting domain-containing protein [Dysgonamonadaceae bacterium]
MKSFLLKKAAVCFLLLCVVSRLSATDIYLSAAGNDNNDGATSENAVATLSKAIGLIPTDGTDYVIKVSGFIPAASECILNRRIYFTIEGDPEIPSGFDSGNTTRVLNLQGAPGKVTLRNLTFKNGTAAEGGGVRAINSGEIVLENCIFTNNTTTGNSGTLHLYNVADTKIFKCTFRNNKAKQGGGVFQNNGGKIAMDSCLIENNDLSSVGGSSGGGIYLGNPNGFSLANSIIRFNKVAAYGGGIALAVSTAAMTDKTVTITNTLLANNESNQGGGIYINNAVAGGSTAFSLINSTLYKNLSVSYGGALFVVGNTATGSSVKIVNATIVENYTQGNGGHGGGINFRDASPASLTRYIYNSILEDNGALNNGNPQNSDLTSSYTAADGTDFFLRNSFVAVTQAGLNAYEDQAGYGNKIRYGSQHASGLASPSQAYIDLQNAIPLLSDAFPALTGGNAQYLKDLNINTDQLGNIRLFAGDKCAAGAVEVPDDYIVDDPKNYKYQHFIIYGQSLSVGKLSYQALPETPLPDNYMLGGQIWIANGNSNLTTLNPLISNFNHNMSNTGENPLTGAVNHIRLACGNTLTGADKFIATSVGDGGRSIAQLSKGHELKLYDHYLSALQSARTVAHGEGSTITCPAIFWMQGETDYINLPSLSKNAYKAALIQLKNDMQADAISRYDQTANNKPLFFTYQTNGSWTRTKGGLGVGMAQVEAANENADIVCAGPVYPVTSMPDGHLDANGYRWYGEMFGKVYYQTKVLGQKFKPLQPTGVEINGNEITIRFYVPVPPLVLDINTVQKINDYGFEVYVDGFEPANKKTITSVQLVGADAVKLTCPGSLTGEVHVVYAGQGSGSGQKSGHGNLRDSDPATGYYNYRNPEGKSDGVNYDYPHNPFDDPRHVDWTYVPAGGEPKDEEGHEIWEKPYPLYNFSVAFCKTIDNNPLATGYKHLIMYGQSLSCGAQGYPPLSTEPVRGNYMLGSQVWINYGHPAGDLNQLNPLVSNIPYSDRTKDRNYAIMGEHPLTGAVNHIQAKTQGTADASRILATSAGTGGCAIEQLEKGTGLYTNQFYKSLTVAKDVLGNEVNLSCPAIFWLQGEANTVENTNGYTTGKNEYKAKLLHLKNDMQADVQAKYGQAVPPVLITYQMGGPWLKTFYDLPISMAQLEASNENADVICAGPVYQLTLPTSGAHPNSNGYRWYGEMLGKVYYKTQILKEDFKPLQPIAFYRTENANELKIRFLVPHLPLVLDDNLVAHKTGYGFEVKRNNSKLTVSNVSIDNDCVILSLSQALLPADEIEISYAGIDLQAGNLRDSDPYQALTAYEDLDRSAEGIFFYPRKDNATLRPRLEPKDAAGNAIYNKPYPLYNFCVAFYKKLLVGEMQTTSLNAFAGKQHQPEVYITGNTLVVEGAQVRKLEIFDLSGKCVKSFPENAGLGKFLLDNLNKGIYISRIITEKENYSTKIVW